MAAWTVEQTSEFQAKLGHALTNLTKRLEDAFTKPPDTASEALRQYKEFEAFAILVSDITDGQADPADHLRLSPLRASYSLIAVLTVGKWQASFLVDRERRIITATSADEVSPRVEAFKNLFRRRFS